MSISTRGDLEIAYRKGTIGRGKFRRIAKRFGWSPEKVIGFIKKWKANHKAGRRSRSA